MATANHVLLRRITLTDSASSVTFDSIPQTGYTDLKIVASARDASTGAYANDLNININGASTNVSTRVMYGTGAAVASTTSGVWAANIPANNATANTFGNAEFYFPNYNSTSTPKSFSVDSVTENNATNSLAMLTAGLFNTNTAISSITFLLYGGTSFAAGSSFSLYGIADVNTTPLLAPKADGGDIIKTDGTYWYHIFTSTGVFKPQLNLTCDYLVVAGGGAGGGSWGGGGGAGGYRTGSSYSATSSTSYTIAVGAGGAGRNDNGYSGSDSTFGSITAAGGGGGGYYFDNGRSGGSGGGGAGGYGGLANHGQGGAGNTPSTSPSQGNNGGEGYSPSDYSSNRYGGGGGGSASTGSSATSGSYGAGGSGTSNSISGTAVTYAAGGNGNNGGGGAGAAGTGNGGAGGPESVTGQSGGSGIVIIRYPV